MRLPDSDDNALHWPQCCCSLKVCWSLVLTCVYVLMLVMLPCLVPCLLG